MEKLTKEQYEKIKIVTDVLLNSNSELSRNTAETMALNHLHGHQWDLEALLEKLK